MYRVSHHITRNPVFPSPSLVHKCSTSGTLMTSFFCLFVFTLQNSKLVVINIFHFKRDGQSKPIIARSLVIETFILNLFLSYPAAVKQLKAQVFTIEVLSNILWTNLINCINPLLKIKKKVINNFSIALLYNIYYILLYVIYIYYCITIYYILHI